jgi:ComF family protein
MNRIGSGDYPWDDAGLAGGGLHLRNLFKARHMISAGIGRIYRVVGAAVFPTRCLVCGDFFSAPDSGCRDSSAGTGPAQAMAGVGGRHWPNHLLAPFLCPVCNRGFTLVESPLCTCCGIPFKSRQGEDHLCGDCSTSAKKYRMARALLVVDQGILNLVHSYKYKGKIQLAEPLGNLLLAAFQRYWESQPLDVIVPVPLHRRRFRERGFNQAFLLMRNWPKRAGADPDHLSAVQIERNVLLRSANTAPQTSLGRAERLTNIKNAFEVRLNEKIKNKAVLLVDDVYTTGATVNECARTLLEAGARQVDVLTLARAV